MLPLVMVVALGVAMVGCSSSKTSSTSSTSSSGAGVSVTTAAAGTTVNIVLNDTQGTDGPMTMTVNPTSAKAGSVTFDVKNTGTIEHEVVVLPLPAGTEAGKLPVETSGPDVDKVSEDGSLGESSEIPAGGTKTFTIDNMTAGNYVLVCNIAKHYAMGMFSPFTVS